MEIQQHILNIQNEAMFDTCLTVFERHIEKIQMLFKTNKLSQNGFSLYLNVNILLFTRKLMELSMQIKLPQLEHYTERLEEIEKIAERYCGK